MLLLAFSCRKVSQSTRQLDPVVCPPLPNPHCQVVSRCKELPDPATVRGAMLAKAEVALAFVHCRGRRDHLISCTHGPQPSVVLIYVEYRACSQMCSLDPWHRAARNSSMAQGFESTDLGLLSPFAATAIKNLSNLLLKIEKKRETICNVKY